MGIGPVSGSGIVLNGIPANKPVCCSAFSQSAWTQVVQVVDSAGHVVLNISGSGGAHQIGQGVFTSNGGNYTVKLTTQQHGASQVLYDYGVMSIGTNVYMGYYTFVTEDGGGTDYNDCYLTMAWFTNVG